ncbi:MAG: ABC transporter permease [Bacteroidales bacterium]
MNLQFFIAKRYLLSKKTHNIINIISGISVAGITVGTMALVIVLSVFNGFESLVESLYNTFDPDLKITVAVGKTFNAPDLPKAEIVRIPGIVRYTEVVEENALLRYHSKQFLATIKGVSPDFEKLGGLDSMVVEGKPVLQRDSFNYAVPGYGIAYFLGIDLNIPTDLLDVYVPNRTGNVGSLSPEESFTSEPVMVSGIFSVQQDFDSKYVIVPLRFARQLTGYTNELTSIEISLKPGTDVNQMQQKLAELTGGKFKVKNRFQQQEVLYKIMKSEKLAIFLILSFILLIATFNVIGSLSMLILDKKKDITVLRSLGANDRLIRRIFLTEGLLITFSGAIGGLVLGFIVCWLQQRFGLLKLQTGAGTFVVDAYPVKMMLSDFALVFVTVSAIGMAAAWYPVRRISQRFLDQRL